MQLVFGICQRKVGLRGGVEQRVGPLASAECHLIGESFAVYLGLYGVARWGDLAIAAHVIVLHAHGCVLVFAYDEVAASAL